MGSFTEEYLKLKKKREMEPAAQSSVPFRSATLPSARVPTATEVMSSGKSDLAPVMGTSKTTSSESTFRKRFQEQKAEKEAREAEDREKKRKEAEEKYKQFAKIFGEDDAQTKLWKRLAMTDEEIAAEQESWRRGRSAREKQKEDSWFTSGAFKDGYDFGDISKTILGTSTDLTANVGGGLLEIGEKVIDAGAFGVGAVGEFFGADFSDDVKDFIKKDLYDGEKIAANTIGFGGNALLALMGEEYDDVSLLGEKADSLAQSGGQLVGTIGLQAVGVPWFVTSGVTSFGGEVERAFNDNADYLEAGFSGAVTAGAEMLTEKLFGGSGLGEKGLINLDALTRAISNKGVKLLVDFGVDMAAEGAEEIASEFLGTLGQQLSTERKKTWEQLLNDEEAMDEYIHQVGESLFGEEAREGYRDAAIGGALLGGIANVKNVHNAQKNGTDYRTGLNESEQTVFDKLLEERAAEAKKEGKKVSKAELHDSVMNDLEKGYITPDKIEEILGGDSYKAYKDTLANEEALKTELDELRNIKSGDMTDVQRDRLAELKGMDLSNMANTEKQGSAWYRKNLDSKMANLVKDTKLAESYNEKARRGQAFQADLSKYGGGMAAIVQKAVDSGVLNNTNRTHEFVDMIAKISADKGVSFDFTNNEKLTESGFALNGKTINGYVTKDGVTLNIDAAKSLNTVVGHEIAHVLEGTELYGELSKAITEYAKTKGDYQGRYDTLAELYKDVKDADIDKELTADLVGDYLFTDKDFVNNLSVTNRNVFEKIYDEIKYLYKMATAGSKEARELEKVKKVFEDAYKQSGKAKGEGTKFSISKDIENFDKSWYNEINLPAEEQARVQSEALTWNTNKRNQLITQTLSNEITYRYVIDDDGIVHIYGRETSENIHERKNEYDNANGERLDSTIEELRLRQRNNGIDINFSQDGRKPRKDDTNDNSFVSGEGRSYRTGYSKNRANAYGRPKKIGWNFNEDGSYDVTYSDGTQEKENIAPTKEASSKGGVFFDGKKTKFSLSNSDGKALTKEQNEYFKDSKVRDENGNLKVMYHGSQDAGFHIFDPSHSDDGISLFFVDRNEVATSYSGTSETYEAKTIHTAEDMNKFIESIGAEGYEVVEENGKFTLLYEGDRVADSNTAKGIYDEFCWYEGVGEGDANYKVYLNLTNPLEVDAKGRPWNKIDAEFSQEVYDKYNSLTAEEKAALVDLAEWEDFRLFNSEIQEARGDALASAYAKMGEDCNIYDLFSVAADNFSEDSMRENARGYLKTRDYAQRAKEGGYDGVIIKNVHDNGGYSNGSEGASTVAIAFNSEQVKSVANEKPTGDKDIRYSLSPETDKAYLDAVNKGDTETAARLVEEAAKQSGYAVHAYHGTRRGDRVGNVFLPERATSGPMAFFTDNKDIAENYAKSKQDTSMAYDPDFDQYETQFRIKTAYTNQDIPLYMAWRMLPLNARNRITEKAGQLHENWDGDYELILDPDTNEGNGGFQWQLKEARGNTIKALVEQWLNSGTLFNEEARFLDVLEMAGVTEEFKKIGMDSLYFKDPNARHEKVYDTFLKITKPFDTASVDEQFIAELEEWYENQDQSQYDRKTADSDLWDKNNIDAYDFAERLRSDLENGTTHAWTSIPDAVTDYLKSLGYDGIKDAGGKNGGIGHTVWIPFSSEQVKSAEPITYDDNGNVIPLSERFNEGKTDIRNSLSPEGSTPKSYGNWNVRGEDVKLAPTKEDISKVENTTEGIAPVQEDIAKNATTTPEAVAPTVDKVVDYSVDEEEAPSMREIYGEGYAPIENAYTIEREIDNIRNEAKAVYEEYDRLVNEGKEAEAEPLFDKFIELSARGQDLQNKAEAYKAEERGYFDSLSDADAPPEVEAPYSESDIIDPFDERDIKAVGNQKVKAYMYENPEVKPFFQEEATALLGEWERAERAQTYYNGWIKQDMSYDFAKDIPEVYRVGRDVSPSIEYLRDTVGMSYADIKKGLDAIIEDNGAENIAAAKKIEFELNNRLMDGYIDDSGAQVPPNQEYRNLIKEKGVTEYNEEAKKSFFKSVNAGIAPVAPTENIAPIAPTYDSADKKQIPGQQTIFEDKPTEAPTKETPTEEAPTEEPKIAKVLPSTPKEQKKVKLWQKIKSLVFDKQSAIEDISLKTKNRELMGKADFMLRSESRAQRHIKNKLMPILEKIENTGDRNAYETYAYHLHNIDRMSLEGNVQPRLDELKPKFEGLKPEQIRAIAATKITEKTTEKTANTIREAKEYLDLLEVKNKPVFADEMTADASREFVKNFEAEHKDARGIADSLTEYNNELRQMMVDAGIISQETADLWAKMYPHYVPIRRAGKNGAAVKVPLDSMRTGVNAPIARAEGGNSDMESLLDVMGARTEQVYRAVARNSFGVELMNTLGTVTDSQPTDIDEILDTFDNNYEELLKKGENGANPSFTVFVDGKRVTFDITEELYDALKPTNDLFKANVPGMSFLTKLQRGILTNYNPTFIVTNFFKDIQDVIINSQHAGKTYANVPTAVKELIKGGKWITEYMDNGGEDLTYFDSKKQVFKQETKVKKVLGWLPNKVAAANNFIERLPRLAEYIASRKSGASVEVAMLDAARVTTNFAAGGDLTKFANRNGFTFLNASVQGAVQQVRNVREAKANGLKGTMQLAAKFAMAGLPIMLLNHLLWDDDEEYEELSDYVKDNYYIVAKYGDGKFVRIPKGRAVAVIQSAFEQMKNLVTGDDEADMERFGQLLVENIAPNNPLDNNVIAPIWQAASNKTWYGEDLVPTRLQNLPDEEQYDETTDSISKWFGEMTGYSPYKINYLLDQYSGGVGDMLLPSLTPESDGGGVLAPFIDKFTTDSVMKNQNVSDFYETVDELTKLGNSMDATDKDILSSKYMNSVSAELGKLYQQKREIQSSADYTDEEKDELVRDIQKQIDSIAKEGLSSYGEVKIDGPYANVGNRHYRWHEPEEGSEAEAGWQKITDEQLEKQNEVTKGLGITAGQYWGNKGEYDFAYEYPEKYKFFKDNGISYETYKAADEDGKRAYTWAYNNPGKYTLSKAVSDDFLTYYQYRSDLYDLEADKDENGKSISGSKKEKVIEYVNNMDLDYGQKIILFRSMYDSKEDRDNYNYDIVEYLNSREDITYKEMETILIELGFTVDSDGNIYWD